MAKLLAMYKTPKDAKAFDDYYYSTHVPIAKKIVGLRSYEVSKGTVASPGGAAPYHLIATLSFDSLEALQSALGSSEGVAAGNDLANFATGGVELIVFDHKTI